MNLIRVEMNLLFLGKVNLYGNLSATLKFQFD